MKRKLGTAQESKHVLLIGLHAGLVEGVDLQHVAADAAGELKEIEELAQSAGIHLGAAQDHGRSAAVVVSGQGALAGHLTDKAQGLASQIVQGVAVVVACPPTAMFFNFFDSLHGAANTAAPLLFSAL